MALASLMAAGRPRKPPKLGQSAGARDRRTIRATAKRVIYLHMAGSPPNLDLFDYKPELVKLDGQACPDEFLEGQAIRLHHRHAQAARHAPRSSRSTARAAPGCPTPCRNCRDRGRLCVIHSMNTDQFNHAPAELLLYTGSPRRAGRRWVLGDLRAGHRRTRTCPASWC